MKNFCYFLLLIFSIFSISTTKAEAKSAKYFNEKGFHYQQSGNYEKALKHYLLAIKKNPNCYAAQNNIGTIYYILNKYDESINHYNKAIKLKPNSFVAHYSKGLTILALLNKIDKNEYTKSQNESKFKLSAIKNRNISLDIAINELEKAEKLSKNNTKVQLALGIAYFKNKQMHEAINKFKNVLKYEPQEPIANFYTGLTLHKDGDYSCINYYKVALKSDPYYTKAYIQISKALMENDEPEKAFTYVEKGLNVFNHNTKCCLSTNNVLISQVQEVEKPIKYSKTAKSKGDTVYNSRQSQFNEEDKEKLVELSNKIRLFQ